MGYAVEMYNQLFKEGKLIFVNLNLAKLPANSASYAKMWVVDLGYQAKMYPFPLGGEYLLTLNHDKVKYLLLAPDEPDPTGPPGSKGCHIWADKDFENIENNVALAELSSKLGFPKMHLKSLFDAFDSGGRG